MVIFDQWPKLHLGLDVLSNEKNLERYLVFIVHFILAVFAFLDVYLLKKKSCNKMCSSKDFQGLLFQARKVNFKHNRFVRLLDIESL